MKSRTHCSVLSLFASSLSGLAAIALFLAPGKANATAIYWDGGSGNWSTVTAWSTASNATTPDPAAVPGTADTATFNISTVNGAATISLNGSQSALGVTFANTAATIIQGTATGQTLTLGASGLTVNSGAGAVTIGSTTAANAAGVVLGASQVWTNSSGNVLTVTNGITGTNLNLSLAGGSVTMGSQTSTTSVINLGTGTFTSTVGSMEMGANVNTMGTAVIKSGSVFVRAASNFGTASVQLGDTAANATGASLRLASGVTFTRPITLNSGTTGGITINTLGSASVTVSGAVSGTNSSLTVQTSLGTSGTGAITMSGGINHVGSLTLSNSSSTGASVGTVTISGVIGSNVTALNVSKSGSATGTQKGVLSSTSNAYTGATTINSGAILQLGASNVIPDGSGKGNVVVNGTFDLNTFSETINGLTGSGTIDKTVATNTSTLTVGSNGQTSTFPGTIKNSAGTLALAKTGSGTITLSGTNTYTGTTTVNASGGTLQFSQRTALYNATPASWTATNLIVNSGTVLGVNVGGTGEFTTSDLDTLAAVGSATGGFKTGAFLGIDTTNATGTFSYTSNVANPNAGANVLGLVKLGTGTLSLSGGSTFTGGVTVRLGTVLIDSATALGAGGTLNIGSVTGGSALIDGAYTVANPIQLSASPASGTNIFGGNTDANSTASGAILMAGNATFSQAATTGTNALNLTGSLGTNNPGTYTATFAGPGAINVTGPLTNGSIGALAANITGGNVTFSGANTNTGGVTVTAGTLNTTGAGVFTDTADVKLITGATLNLNFTGSDRIEYLFIDGVQQANGTWGAIGSGAQHTTSLITGTGLLLTGPINYAWNSTGGDGLFSTAGNWDVNVAPLPSSVLSFGSGSFDTTLTNDLAANTTIDRIKFLAGAAAYTLNGTNNLILTGGIDNLSSNVQTINFPIGLGSAAVGMNASTANLVLTGTISGSGGFNKTGVNTLELDGTNTYTGVTRISAGTLTAGSAGAIPSASTLAFGNTTGTAFLNLTGISQTVAGITFGTQTTGGNTVYLYGDASSTLTTSPATLTFAPAASNSAALTVDMSALAGFTYNNSTGAINFQVGNSANTGTVTVTLPLGTNTITAASLNLAATGGGSGNSNVASLNLGFTNTLNVNSIGLGNSFSRSTGTMQFSSLDPSGPSLKIRDATGTGAASLVVARNSSFGDATVYGGTFDTTANNGTLDALFSSMIIGNAHADGAVNRGVNSTGTFKMGAGTLTATSATIGYIEGTTPTGTNSYNAVGSLQLSAGGTATITTITLANNTLGTLVGGTNKIDGQITLNGSGATTTLNATTIQQGSIVTGETSRVAKINWLDGTIANISTGDLSVSGVGIVLTGSFVGSHVFSVTSGHTATVSSIISSVDASVTPLNKAGAGTLILTGMNTYTGDTLVDAGTLSLTHPVLDDNGDLAIAAGAKVDLNFTGADIVGLLEINGVLQAGNGATYGATGSGATVIDDVHFSGTGKIQVGIAPDPFPAWAASFSLSGGDADKSADPDHDGRSNLLEFALNGNPTVAGHDHKMRTAVAVVAGDTTLTLTLPVRSGVVFSGAGDLVGTADNSTIEYKIQGSTDLVDFVNANVTEVTPALSSGMPALDSGWEYRTFRLPGTVTTNPRGFLRAFVTDTP